ncbi:efflux RND transporter periplasmic adaptor subunit [Microbacterium sp. ZW T5_45]|uniref:efflux RND transporter periplasmic adaptor subunit n=1 Tax=Microbacterium sp. ZW T5_45 TaxID=3378080 RepID=UPI003853E5A3
MSARTFLARFRRRTKIITAAAALTVAAVAIWVFAFLLPSQDTAGETITQTTTASLRTLEKTVDASGTVTPAVQEDIAFAVSGTVTAVNVTAGQTVAAGDVLATVDTLQLEADLLDAKATLAEAQATLADAEDADSSDARINAASAAVDVAQSSVDAANTAMSDAMLVAPAGGLITSVGVAVGDRVSGSSSASSSSPASSTGSSGGAATPGSTSSSSGSSSSTTSSSAFTLVSTTSWSLDVSVGETDVANVQVGQQVELTDDDGNEYFGTVSEVGLLPSTSSGSAQYPATITITGDGEGLFDGISLTGSIVYERRTDVLAVPSAAVTTTDGTSTVTVVDADGAQSEVTVEVGESSGQYTEILSGIAEGDEIVVASFTPGEGNTGTGGFPGGDSTGGFPGGDSTGGFPGGGTGQMPGGQGGAE